MKNLHYWLLAIMIIPYSCFAAPTYKNKIRSTDIIKADYPLLTKVISPADLQIFNSYKTDYKIKSLINSFNDFEQYLRRLIRNQKYSKFGSLRFEIQLLINAIENLPLTLLEKIDIDYLKAEFQDLFEEFDDEIKELQLEEKLRCQKAAA
ncbi:MAG: hypothetical protein P4L22_02165 [Candidatus Babeliales bacterium]|nr:hypothetical protein [Candidatus Babeliales bacterium]